MTGHTWHDIKFCTCFTSLTFTLFSSTILTTIFPSKFNLVRTLSVGKKKKCHWNALTMFSAAAKSRPVYYWWSLEGVSPVTCNLSFNLISVPMKAGSSLLESFQPYSIDIFIHTLLKRSYIIHREKQSKWRENSGLELRLSGFWMDAIPIILGRGYDTLKIYNATLQKPSLCFSHSDRAELFRTLSKMETSVYEIVSL